MSPYLPVQVVDAEHPWLGLSPFTEGTKGFFFGRNHEIRDIFLRVREQPLTVLYGQSGLGKTSLLGAGLIPKLKVEGFRPILVRLGYEPTDPPLIEQVLEAIDEALSPFVGAAITTGKQLPGSTLWELFHHLPTRTPDLIESPPVVIFDQFEEIFTLTQSRERQLEAEALFSQLADLVENRPPAAVQDRLLGDRRLAREYDLTSSPTRIVITLREDYLSQLEAWKKLMPALMRNRMALQLLSGPQALEAVVQPGRLGGRELVSDDVGARIVCFVARRPAGTPLKEIGAVPPLLSLLCDELNATRLATGAATITGAQVERQSADILQNFYARSFDGLDASVRRFVEDRMVTVGGHRNPVAREDALAELQSRGLADPAAAIDQLVQGRLLSTEDRGGLQRLEITHDVLVPLVVRSRDERKVREAKEQAAREAAEHRRRLRRARLAMIMYGTLTVISMIAGAWAWRAQGIANAALEEAKKREQEVHKSRDALTLQVYDNSIALAERELTQKNDIGQASRLLEGENCPPHLRGWEWHYLMRLRDGPRAPLKDHGTGLWGAEFNPDGTLIATCSIDGTVKIWEAESGKLIRTIVADDIPGISPLLNAFGIPHIPIMCLSFSPDGKQIATGSFLPMPKFAQFAPLDLPKVDPLKIAQLDPLKLNPFDILKAQPFEMPKLGAFDPMKFKGIDPLNIMPDRDSPGLVRIWDVETGKLQGGFQDQKGVVLALTYSLDGKYIASSSINPDYSFVVWEAATGKLIKRVQGHKSHVHRLQYHPNGQLLATTDTGGIVKMWSLPNLDEVRSIVAHPAPIIGLAFSPPDGKSFATAGQDGSVRVWDTASGTKVLELEGHASAALDVRYSPDGKRLASTGADKTIRLWDSTTGQAKITLRGHEELVWSVAFSKDGQRLVSASFDKTARIWDATPRVDSFGPGEFVLGGHTDRVNSVAVSPDGRHLVSGSWDTTVRIWNAETGAPAATLQGHQASVWCVAISRDGRRVASASWDRTAKVWDRETGRLLATFTEHTAPVHSIAFSPDGNRVASGSFDGQLKIWDATSGQVITNCDGFIFPVMAVAFSPDGTHVASGGSDRVVKIWDAKTGKLVLSPFKGHTASIHGIAYSPDGTRVVSACWDHSTRVWDVAPGGNSSRKRELFALGVDLDPATGARRGHVDRVNGMAFSSDGKLIATASEDKTVRLWDANTGLEVAPPRLHRAFVWSVTFSADDKRLISASWEKDKWIRAWKIELNPVVKK